MSIQKNIIKLLLHVSSDFNKLYNHVIDELTKATIVSTERVTPEELYKISNACTPTEKERVQALLDSYKQALQSLIQQGITRAVMLSTITQQRLMKHIHVCRAKPLMNGEIRPLMRLYVAEGIERAD